MVAVLEIGAFSKLGDYLLFGCYLIHLTSNLHRRWTDW